MYDIYTIYLFVLFTVYGSFYYLLTGQQWNFDIGKHSRSWWCGCCCTDSLSDNS